MMSKRVSWCLQEGVMASSRRRGASDNVAGASDSGPELSDSGYGAYRRIARHPIRAVKGRMSSPKGR
jgi:hypothetical protein